MLYVNTAREATLAAFKAAIADGAARETATQLAIAKYRAYFPTASGTDVTQVLAGIAWEDRRTQSSQ